MYRLYLFSILVLLLSCRGSNQSISETELKDRISDKLGEDFVQVDRGELALCMSKPEVVGSEWKTFLVIDTATGQVLYGPERKNAIINWYADRELIIKVQSEVISDKQNSTTNTYLVNVDSGETSTLQESR